MLKIHFADSSKIFLSGLKTIFSTQECGFQIAGSSENFIDLLANLQIRQPDILITETSLPLDNYNATQKTSILNRLFEAQEASPKTKIYLMSGSVAYHSLRKIQNLNISGYFLKNDQLAHPKILPQKISESYSSGKELYSKQILQLQIDLNQKYHLTDRQIVTMEHMLVHSNKSKAEVGKILGINERTISGHASNVCQQLNASTTLDALKKLLALGFISPDIIFHK